MTESSRPRVSLRSSSLQKNAARSERPVLIPGGLDRLGAYTIQSRLASGGMAEVFIARRDGPHGFQKKIALKRILPQFAKDQEFVEMFIQEARLAAHLDHPNIVQVFDFGEHQDCLYIAMELVDGTTVNRLLRAVYLRGEVVPLEGALHIAAQTARALAYAHNIYDENGKSIELVHRDVSPANILLTRMGHVKLSDFGIAHAARTERRPSEAGRVRGKLGYMSPEQVMGEPLDGRSDVFALATVLSEMLIATPLFGEGSELDILLRIRNADTSVLRTVGRTIPSDVRRLLERALERKPADRPKAGEFAEALETMLQRRKASERGPQALARLLMRLELVTARPADTEAFEPGARPTWLLKLASGVETNTRDVPSVLPENTQPLFWVRTNRAVPDGPFDFPELIRRVVLGLLDKTSEISRDKIRYVQVGRLPELIRFFNSPGLQWSNEETQNPTWQGQLNMAALLPTVFRIATQHESGLLYIFDGQRKKKIYFQDGRPDFIASTDRKELLGEYLIDTGVCVRPEIDKGLMHLSEYGGHLGDALVGMGVLRPAELYRAVSGQVRHRYLEAFRWKNGDWCYVRGAQSGEESFPLATDPYQLLRDAAKESDPLEMYAALSPLSTRILNPALSPPVSREMFRLEEGWDKVLGEFPGDRTVRDAMRLQSERFNVPFEEVIRATYLGVSCQLLIAR